MAKAIKGRRYRHYKGCYYTVECIARDEDTGEDLVVYRDSEDNVWVQKRARFEGKVGTNGNRVERFCLEWCTSLKQEG